MISKLVLIITEISVIVGFLLLSLKNENRAKSIKKYLCILMLISSCSYVLYIYISNNICNDSILEEDKNKVKLVEELDIKYTTNLRIFPTIATLHIKSKITDKINYQLNQLPVKKETLLNGEDVTEILPAFTELERLLKESSDVFHLYYLYVKEYNILASTLTEEKLLEGNEVYNNTIHDLNKIVSTPSELSMDKKYNRINNSAFIYAYFFIFSLTALIVLTCIDALRKIFNKSYKGE